METRCCSYCVHTIEEHFAFVFPDGVIMCKCGCMGEAIDWSK